tara:strand:+ start:1138 stop:2151 length:1014 start_codon:yes stop_codon:yes gene_type:complete
MNVFIFDDLTLRKGVLISYGSIKKINLEKLTKPENTLFVLPNELIQYKEFQHNLKNKQNIHASILNNSSSLNINEEDQLVLNTSSNRDFFLTNKKYLENIKKVFSIYNTTISITSDLLFFKESFKRNSTYQNNVFLTDSEEIVKLSTKSFNLLEDDIKVKKVTDLDLKKLKNINFASYKLNTFNVSSFLKVKNLVKPLLAALVVIFTIYITALFNIYSNYAQIEKMSVTLETIYSDIYPSENITDIYQQIDSKLNSLNNDQITNLSRTVNLLRQLSETVNIIKVEYMQDKLLITCLFNNDAEESIFLNQQSRLNYELNIIESRPTQVGKITKISYVL